MTDKKKDDEVEILEDGMPADFGLFVIDDDIEEGDIEDDGLPSNFANIIDKHLMRMGYDGGKPKS